MLKLEILVAIAFFVYEELMIIIDRYFAESTKRIRQMEDELRQSGNGREELPTYRFQSPPSRSGPPVLPVSQSLLDRLTSLVEKHQKVWTTNLLHLYREEYGVELQLKTFGMKDMSDLVDVLQKERPIDVRDFLITMVASFF